MLTKGAIGNLVNRYRAVLRKCHLLNTFGSLAVASMLVLGGAGAAWGYEITTKEVNEVTKVIYDGEEYTLQTSQATSAGTYGGDEKRFAWVERTAANGPGMAVGSGKVIVKDSLFIGNKATQGSAGSRSGGAVYFSNKDNVLHDFDNVKFVENYVSGEGGAIKSCNNAKFTLKITNSKFIGNKATVNGGAISSNGNDIELSNTTFDGNTATGTEGLPSGGGAIFMQKSTTTTIDNCNFTNNTTGNSGGAIRASSSASKLVFTGNNIFSGNTQKGGVANDIYHSGAMSIESGSTTLYGGISRGSSPKFITVSKDASFTVDTRAAGSDPFQDCPIKIDGAGDITLRSSKSIIKDGKYHEIYGNNITLEFTGGTVIESTGPVVLEALNEVNIIGSAKINKGTSKGTFGQFFVTAKTGTLDDVSVGTGATFGLSGTGEAGCVTTLKSLTTSGNSSLGHPDYGLAATVDTLDMQGGTLNIIDSDVTIGTLKTTGGTIFIDPSNVKVSDLEGKLDADFFIGEGSTVDFGGADMSSAPAVSDKTAVLALGPGKSIEVDKGSLEVNGALTGTAPTPPADGTVKFAADSLFVVDGSTKGGAIKGSGGALTVEDGAKLHINNARVGEFAVASNFDPNAITVGGWNGSNLTITTSNVLTEAVAATRDGDDVIVSIVAKDAASVFPDLHPARNVDTMMAEGQNDTSDDAPAGIRMLSRALEKTASPDSIDAVNEASSAAVTVGVQNTALRIADAASNTVIGHLSLAQHDGSRAIHADGADFWAAPMYGNLYTSGMAAGGQSVRGQFGGLALGADVEAGQFLGGKFRIGAAINGGGGQSETSGTATSAQNDYDFGGLNFYAGWNNGALNLIASVGYAFGNHEVEMGLPASLGMSSAKADVDTAAFTADLRAEYQLKTGWLDVLPHVGVRYTALRTDAHDLKSGGEVLNSVERDTQNIVQFPIGVTLSRDFDLAGWALKPAVDLSFIPAAGDKDARTSVNFSGIDAVDSFDTRIMDSSSWAATVGVQAEKGAFSLGLNYGVQASSHETDQNVQLKLGWKF